MPNLSSSEHLSNIKLTLFERQVAQRMMISIRNFCRDDNLDVQNNQKSKQICHKPVTLLPKELAGLISDTELGGVVLFSENIESNQQVIQLTHDLQAAANRSKNRAPLFIGIDQEGGRVVRLKRENSTAFSGNMAIGATFPNHGKYYAEEVGRIIGLELNALGINLNFSPDVDINNHPDNPVINVRSFGEEPEVVSKLGIAMMDAFQAQNVIATLKHFPGHGNTNIDSHTGLPSVDYDRSTMKVTDLVPFQDAIDQSHPGMIMTAHIQYPNMDDSTIVNKKGEAIVAPATMSYKILTQLLRDEMGYQGVLVTDALNMGGISNHFELDEATARSLLAGADIALMPYRVSKTSDIEGFKRFVRRVAGMITSNKYGQDSMNVSLKRIGSLKQQYLLKTSSALATENLTASDGNDNRIKEKSIAQKLVDVQFILASSEHRARERMLALDSVTLLKDKKQIIPWSDTQGDRIHLVVQDSQQLELIMRTLLDTWERSNKKPLYLTHTLLSEYDDATSLKKLTKADLVMVFFSEKRESAVVKGELDELLGQDRHSLNTSKIQAEVRIKNIKHILTYAQSQGINTFVAGMQSPYEMQQFMNLSDAILVAYDPSIYCDKKANKLVGYTYEAVIKALLGVVKMNAKLPVTLGN